MTRATKSPGCVGLGVEPVIHVRGALGPGFQVVGALGKPDAGGRLALEFKSAGHASPWLERQRIIAVQIAPLRRGNAGVAHSKELEIVSLRRERKAAIRRRLAVNRTSLVRLRNVAVHEIELFSGRHQVNNHIMRGSTIRIHDLAGDRIGPGEAKRQLAGGAVGREWLRFRGEMVDALDVYNELFRCHVKSRLERAGALRAFLSIPEMRCESRPSPGFHTALYVSVNCGTICSVSPSMTVPLILVVGVRTISFWTPGDNRRLRDRWPGRTLRHELHRRERRSR